MLCSAVRQVSLPRSLAIPALRAAQTAVLRHPSLTLLRPAPTSPRDALHARAFSSTPLRAATEDVEKNARMQAVFAQQQKLLKLLQDKPETMEHIRKFIDQLKENGIDVASGKMPSKMDIMKLLMKVDVRESAMKMAAAFQEAGIDLQSKEMMQSLLAMKDEIEGK
ncbi:hypothetical protein ACG7TL_003530 [Trametes sanguinea]